MAHLAKKNYDEATLKALKTQVTDLETSLKNYEKSFKEIAKLEDDKKNLDKRFTAKMAHELGTERYWQEQRQAEIASQLTKAKGKCETLGDKGKVFAEKLTVLEEKFTSLSETNKTLMDSKVNKEVLKNHFKIDITEFADAKKITIHCNKEDEEVVKKALEEALEKNGLLKKEEKGKGNYSLSSLFGSVSNKKIYKVLDDMRINLQEKGYNFDGMSVTRTKSTLEESKKEEAEDKTKDLLKKSEKTTKEESTKTEEEEEKTKHNTLTK